jgi:ribosomal protein L19
VTGCGDKVTVSSFSGCIIRITGCDVRVTECGDKVTVSSFSGCIIRITDGIRVPGYNSRANWMLYQINLL